MKPSDLRRDAYTLNAIADSLKGRAHRMFDAGQQDLGYNLNASSGHLSVAVDLMVALADELEARNAS